MKAEPSLSSMKELKKTVMPFAQMRMKETNLLGPDVLNVRLVFDELSAAHSHNITHSTIRHILSVNNIYTIFIVQPSCGMHIPQLVSLAPQIVEHVVSGKHHLHQHSVLALLFR
ncbi:hypothetical protein WJX77_011918 [Trebouxia sp. C0004]